MREGISGVSVLAAGRRRHQDEVWSSPTLPLIGADLELNPKGAAGGGAAGTKHGVVKGVVTLMVWCVQRLTNDGRARSTDVPSSFSSVASAMDWDGVYVCQAASSSFSFGLQELERSNAPQNVRTRNRVFPCCEVCQNQRDVGDDDDRGDGVGV